MRVNASSVNSPAKRANRLQQNPVGAEKAAPAKEAASYPALLLLDPQFPVPLLQRNFAGQDTSDCSCVLNTLVDHLLLFALVAILLHAEIKNFL
jgi:hypothetical protein